MGISGLTSFIDKNTHVLKTHELKDCSIVIDGNCMFHHFYKQCHVEALFGGDYDVYRQKIRINFKSLLKCGVTPYIVFDGGYTTDDRKLQTCLGRAKDRITSSRGASIRGKSVLVPLLVYDTFIQTLDELKIPHFTCQFEADCEIAKLANKLNCPVVSADSDFYIFDLTHGFLPLDYIDFNPLYKKYSDGTKSPPYIYCQLYHVEEFVNAFEGLTRSSLPIIATLMGNDYVRPGTFTKLCQKNKCTKPPTFHLSNKLLKSVKLIQWLDIHGDADNSVDNILPFIQSKEKFLSSIKGYMDIDKFEGCDLFEYFSNTQDNFRPQAAPTFSGYNGSLFPTWFLSSVCKGEITPQILNAAVLHRVIFRCHVENLKLTTIYKCSEHVRKIIYGILMASDLVGNNSDMVGNNGDLVENNNSDPAVSVPVECEDNFMSEVVQSVVETRTTADTDTDNALVERMIHDDDDSKETFGEDVMNKTLCDTQKSDFDENGAETVDTKEEEDVISDTDTDTNDEEIPVEVNSHDSCYRKKQIHFEEYHRDHKSLKKIYLEPVVNVGSEKLPSLTEIVELSTEKRLSVLLSSLQVDPSFIDKFSPDLSLYMVCLIHWIQHADPQLTEHHLDCAILCPILLYMLNKKGKKSSHKKTSPAPPNPSCLDDIKDNSKISQQVEKTEALGYIDLKQVCKQASNKDRAKFMSVIGNLDRYRTFRPEFCRRKNILLNVDIVHVFIQLQTCMFEVSNLNKLLRFPLPIIQPAFLVNGSFLYNFYNELVSRHTPNNFIEAMLIKGSDLHNVFLRMKSAVLGSLGNSISFFAELGDDIIKRKKKKKGNRKKKNSPSEKVDETEAPENPTASQESEEEIMSIEGFDVQNKFSLLSLK